MNEPIVFKRSGLLASLQMLRNVLPAMTAVGMLLGLGRLFRADMPSEFLMMGIVVAVIAPIIMQLPPPPSQQLMTARWSMIAGLMVRWVALLATLLAVGYVAKVSTEFSRAVVLTWAVTTPALLIVLTVVLDEFIRRFLVDGSNVRSAVFAGYNEASVALDERLRKHPELGVKVVGFFDDRNVDRLGAHGEGRMRGGLVSMAEYVRENGIEVIFVSLPMRNVQRVSNLLDDLQDTTASIYYVPDVFVFDLIQSRSGEILGVPVVALCETPFYGYRGVIKRFMDLVIAGLAVVMLSPVLGLIAALIKAGSPGPIIFRQRRYGLDGTEIVVHKFRTMTVMEDGPTIRQATRDDDRITPLGHVLRRYSLDELPQLFNVLTGTMSLVGPRPHAVAHNEQYRRLIKGYMIRHKVPPGMTGLAQVKGYRGETRRVEEMQARIRYDLEYLRRWTPLLDIKIILQTAVMLLGDRKAY